MLIKVKNNVHLKIGDIINVLPLGETIFIADSIAIEENLVGRCLNYPSFIEILVYPVVDTTVENTVPLKKPKNKNTKRREQDANRESK